MPVSDSPRRAGSYPGTGTLTAFPFAFKVFVPGDVVVILTDAASTETTLLSGYTVTLNADQDQNPGGSVSLIAPVGWRVTLTSGVPYDQSTRFQNLGGFYPVTHTEALDRATVQIQQLAERMSRAVHVPISSDQTPEEFTKALFDAADEAVTAAQQAAQSESAAAQSAASASTDAQHAQEMAELVDGKFTISTDPPSGGKDGDVWFWVQS